MNSKFSLFALLLTVSRILVVSAWGKDGHEIVANIAWNLLSSGTRARVVDILNASTASVTRLIAPYQGHSQCEDCSPLGMIANWADEVRSSKEYSWSSTLHFLNIPDGDIEGGCPVKTTNAECNFNYARDCVADFCVAGAIVNFTDQLLDRTMGRESLMFVTHFVGDIHQPLHASRASDRGGNSIVVHWNVSTFNTEHAATEARNLRRRTKVGHSLNLHAVWDDTIIETALAEYYSHSRSKMEDDLMDLIRNVQKTREWRVWTACANGANATCTSLWGQESWMGALHYAYSNIDATDIETNQILTSTYYHSRLIVVKQRLAIAGVRLAMTLEANLLV